MIATLRMENIRNRVSPHFIFNILNREMGNYTDEQAGNMRGLVKADAAQPGTDRTAVRYHGRGTGLWSIRLSTWNVKHWEIALYCPHP